MRGVTFDALGKTHELRFTTNALCRLEERSGLSFQQLVGECAKPGKRVTTYRLLIWAALNNTVTLEGAGQIMDELGDVETDRLVAAAMEESFPPLDQSAEGNGETTA